MRKARFTEEQITYALKQVESGKPVGEVCRQLGVSEQSFYRWKRKYQGVGIAELRRLRQLEDENRKLKKIVAERLQRAPSPQFLGGRNTAWIRGELGAISDRFEGGRPVA